LIFYDKNPKNDVHFYEYIESFTEGNVIYIVDQNKSRYMPTDDFSRIYVVPKAIEDSMRKEYPNLDDMRYNFAIKGNREMEKFYRGVLTKVDKEYGITAAYSIVGNISLKNVCLELGYYFKYIEMSALRDSEYFNYNLCLYFDNKLMDSAEEGRIRYRKFKEDLEKLSIKKPIPSMCIMLLGAKSYLLLSVIKWYRQNSKYKLGICLPSSYKETNNGWMSDRLLSLVHDYDEELYNNSLVREHPMEKNFPSAQKDLSIYSNDFISQCEAIITSGSNVTFEAMMLGKRVVDLSDTLFSEVVGNNIEDINAPIKYDDWYINFCVFSAYVPFERMFDEKYVAWRKSNPNEYEIFNDNLDYFFNTLLGYKISVEDAYDWEKIYNIRSRTTSAVRSKELNVLRSFSQIDYKCSRIFVCGLGKDAQVVKEIVNNLGGQIEAFLTMDNNDTLHFDNTNVLHWGSCDFNKDDVFIISMRNDEFQKDAFLKLQSAGYTNIVIM
jgi:hypothetical protein